jgi:predicted Na+-dependent transporter
MLSKKTELDKITRFHFLVFAVTLLGSYYLFCFQFPFTCTMNIRYCVPLIPMFAMGLGLLLQHCHGDSKKEKLLRYSSCALVAAFALMTMIVYSQISIPPVTAPPAG